MVAITVSTISLRSNSPSSSPPPSQDSQAQKDTDIAEDPTDEPTDELPPSAPPTQDPGPTEEPTARPAPTTYPSVEWDDPIVAGQDTVAIFNFMTDEDANAPSIRLSLPAGTLWSSTCSSTRDYSWTPTPDSGEAFKPNTGYWMQGTFAFSPVTEPKSVTLRVSFTYGDDAPIVVRHATTIEPTTEQTYVIDCFTIIPTPNDEASTSSQPVAPIRLGTIANVDLPTGASRKTRSYAMIKCNY